MPFPRQSVAAAATFLAFALLGCGSLPLEGVVADPQGTPRVVMESTGGIATLRVRLEIDSATARWQRTVCRLTPDGTPCGADKHTEQGTVDTALRDRLFADTRTDAFLRLPASYKSSGQVADGMAHRLLITTAGFTRTMTWEDGAELPALLDDYVRRVGMAAQR